MRTLNGKLCCGLAVALIACCAAPPRASAVLVDFTYTQTDAVTGAGTVTGTFNLLAYGGPAAQVFTGNLPLAVVTQNDAIGALPVGAVGGINTGSELDSPPPIGVHLNLNPSGTGVVTLSAMVGPDLWTIDAPLRMISGTNITYDIRMFDDPGGAGDAVGSAQFAAWVGENGAAHRHTGDTRTFNAGADTNVINDLGPTALGGNASNDPLGIAASARGNFVGGITGGPVFVDSINFTGKLDADLGSLMQNGMTPVIPPPPSFFMGTSFEEPAAVGIGTSYNDGGLGARDLVNGHGPVVDHTFAGGELGFDLTYLYDTGTPANDITNRTNRVGVTNGFGADSVGVMPTDGNNAYVFANTGPGGNAGVQLTFTPVVLDGVENAFVSVDFLAEDGGWDNDDFIDIHLLLNGGPAEIALLQVGGSFGGNINSIEDTLMTLAQPIPDGTSSVQLVVRASTSDGSDEILFIDRVVIAGDRIVPEPATATLALLSLAGLMLRRRGTRRAA